MNDIQISRRRWIQNSACSAALASTAFTARSSLSKEASDGAAIDIGSRRQLFVDRTMVQSTNGIRLVLHRPVKRDIAIKPEHDWERFGVSYMVAIRDEGRFRAWYRADAAGLGNADRKSLTAYAESDDGVHWRKPELGIVEFQGSKKNNLVWNGAVVNLAPFRDDNPAARPEERFKAVGRTSDLFGLVSPDGLHWKLASKEPLFRERPFDSHNIGFWDPVEKQYVVYTRGVRRDGPVGRGMADRFKGGVRWVRRATSPDFRKWSKLEPIRTGDHPREEFYTNAAVRYERAPDYVLMFPSRFVSGREPQPGWKFGKGVNDIVFLSSRDGINFERTFLEAFIRPGTDEGNWHERSLYMERGLLQTSDTELSLYCMQNWRLPGVHIGRYTLRPDGFVSAQAGYAGGTLVTKPLKFTGERLFLNHSLSAVGSVRVGVETAEGRPIKGLALADCPLLLGDKIDRLVTWRGGDLARLQGRSVRLRFELFDGDLYAFRFGA